MELVRPMKQRIWRWPVIINLFLGGMATSFYLLSILVVMLQKGRLDVSQPATFKLLAPLLACLGFFVLAIEAGRPLRGHHLLRHLRHSWISRETLFGAIFVAAAVLDRFFPHPALLCMACTAAMGLLFSQGFIIYRVRAITAWNVQLIPLIFFTSGLSTGSGLLLVVLCERTLVPMCAMIAMVCVVLNVGVWLLYLHWRYDSAFRKSTENLRRPLNLLLTVGIGHLLPILLLLPLLVGSDVYTGSEIQHSVSVLSGLLLISGGVSQKSGIIMSVSYLKGIVL
jgi:DMSO reductase anchor subunit